MPAIRPSPNEEAAALAATRAELRKKRMIEVRNFENKHASMAAANARKKQSVAEHRQRIRQENSVREMQLTQQSSLEDMYQTSMELFGSSHDAARALQESIDHNRRARSSVEATKAKAAAKRHQLAVEKLKKMNQKKDAEKIERQSNRRRALEMERARAANIVHCMRTNDVSASLDEQQSHNNSGQGQGQVELASGARSIHSYANSYFHFKQPPTAHASIKGERSEADESSKSAADSAKEETARVAAEQKEKKLRQAELRELSRSRGKEAANKVRMARTQIEAEKQLANMERQDYEQRKTLLLNPSSQVVDISRKPLAESKRQQKMEQIFESDYFTVAEPGGRTLANDDYLSRVKILVGNEGSALYSTTCPSDGQRTMGRRRKFLSSQEFAHQDQENISNQTIVPKASSSGRSLTKTNDSGLTFIKSQSSALESAPLESVSEVIDGHQIPGSSSDLDLSTDGSDNGAKSPSPLLDQYFKNMSVNTFDASNNGFSDGYASTTMSDQKNVDSKITRDVGQSLHRSPLSEVKLSEFTAESDLDIDTAWENMIFNKDEMSGYSKNSLDHLTASKIDPAVTSQQRSPPKIVKHDDKHEPFSESNINFYRIDTDLEDSGVQGSGRWRSNNLEYMIDGQDDPQLCTDKAKDVLGDISPSLQQLRDKIDELPLTRSSDVKVMSTGASFSDGTQESALEMGNDGNSENNPNASDHSGSNAIANFLARVIDKSPGTGDIYPTSMGHMSDEESSQGITTALESLVKTESLYVGHPAISRKTPAITALSAGGMKLDSQTQSKSGSRADAHDDKDLHNLLPVWQELKDPVAEAEQGTTNTESLQEAFKRHQHGMIKNSKARIEEIKLRAKSHQKPPSSALSKLAAVRKIVKSCDNSASKSVMEAQSKSEIGKNDGLVMNFAGQTALQTQLPESLKLGPPKMTKSQIIERNKRLYDRLCPEVRQKKEQEALAAKYAKNREKAKAYGIALRAKQRSKQT